MLKNIAIVMVGLVSGLAFGQNTRFIYQVSMKTNKEKADKVTEKAYLDVSPSKSVFYGENRVKRDSVMEKMRETRSFDPSVMQNFRSNINYIVEKDPQNQNLIYKDRIGRDNYSYTEKPDLKWAVLPETMKLGDYKTQKATTEYGGRKWTAWFTTDVPVMDGPYKFSGLPGLIVKIEDENGDYSFDLMQMKKIEDLPQLQSRGQIITVKKEQFASQYKKFQQDPESFLQSQNIGNQRGGGISPPQSRGGDGGNRPQMDPQQKKEMREKMLERIKNDNNPIELK